MAKKALAFTAKPKMPPTFDAAAFTKKLAEGKPITATQQAQFIAWKQWVESTNAYDGTAKGGIRDVVDANAKGVDSLKVHVDSNSQAILELRADVQALKEAPAAHPFP